MTHWGINGRAKTRLAVILAAFMGATPVAVLAQTAAFMGPHEAVKFIGETKHYSDDADAALPLPATTWKLGQLSRGPLNFSLSVTPESSFISDDRGQQSSAGAQLRLSATSSESTDHTWFAFAGAHGRAVKWDMGASAFDLQDFVQLKRTSTVGDFQAGIAYQMGDAQFALGYVKRTYRGGVVKETTDYAGVSLAWRH